MPKAGRKKSTKDVVEPIVEVSEPLLENESEKTENKSEKNGLLEKFPFLKSLPMFKDAGDDVRSFRGNAFLIPFKPNERYVFHSDYFEVDDGFASILNFFHQDAATDNFGAFWGINRIPGNLGDDIVTVSFEQIRRMSEDWIRTHQSSSEGVAEMNANQQDDGGTNSGKGKARREVGDLEIIASELQDGASYLHVHYRLLVKAPTLEKLDDAIQDIERLYIDRFATLSAAPYSGEQRRELTNLFRANKSKQGKGFYFTSTEFAGSYSLVTHGLEDPKGEYVGTMQGDVNNSAVLLDVNKYKHHIVIANEGRHQGLGDVYYSDMWGSKLGQAAMLEGGKVVHVLLGQTNLDALGPSFKSITNKVDLNRGDVNMFEMFGDAEDELAIFAAQMQKLVLMAEQAYETTESDRSIIRGSLEEIATKFYIDQRMWYDNATYNRDRLRVVGIPHKDVPRLQMFVSYLDAEYKAMANKSVRDDEKLHALSVLAVTFKNLMTTNGDLFNAVTSDTIDGVVTGKRVIYDFAGLMRRGKGIAMAQLVNIIGFAVGHLRKGDVIIFHGAEHIDNSVMKYVQMQFEHVWSNGGRVAFLYYNIDKMLAEKSFNMFDKADYTIVGNMTDTTVAEYQKLLGQEIPPDLAALIANKSGSAVCYIRRGFDNVVFGQDLSLGIKNQRRVR